MAYLLTAFVGPTLVSPDLVNGAMPLYFCRPFSRAQYVAGKMTVLMALLALITWVPGVLLFIIESSVTGWDWGLNHLWIGGGLFVGLVVWDAVLSLIALALSAWVKWRIAAGAMVLGVFFAGAGFGSAIDNVLRTNYGSLIDLTQVAHTVWADLLRFDSGTDMSVRDAWIVLIVTCVLCAILLARRVRAFEVVK
jgi:ABC-2 type transport system permease protein